MANPVLFAAKTAVFAKPEQLVTKAVEVAAQSASVLAPQQQAATVSTDALPVAAAVVASKTVSQASIATALVVPTRLTQLVEYGRVAEEAMVAVEQ